MTATKLGIWMDHEQAHLIEFTTDPMTTTTINSKFAHAKEEGESKGENHGHSKQQHRLGKFYKELGERIRKYKEVILFGPTSAKSELANSLRDDHLFDSIKIDIESAEKMTDNQSHAFVRNHFSKN
jgi:hypothetical protein